MTVTMTGKKVMQRYAMVATITSQYKVNYGDDDNNNDNNNDNNFGNNNREQ